MPEQVFQTLAGDVTVTAEADGGVFHLVLLEGEKIIRAELTRAQMRALSDNLKHLVKVED